MLGGRKKKRERGRESGGGGEVWREAGQRDRLIRF